MVVDRSLEKVKEVDFKTWVVYYRGVEGEGNRNRWW